MLSFKYLQSLEDKKKNNGAEVLETSEGIMASDHIEKAKKDNAKLVNEFWKMINEDEKLREFAERNSTPTSISHNIF